MRKDQLARKREIALCSNFGTHTPQILEKNTRLKFPGNKEEKDGEKLFIHFEREQDEKLFFPLSYSGIEDFVTAAWGEEGVGERRQKWGPGYHYKKKSPHKMGKREVEKKVLGGRTRKEVASTIKEEGEEKTQKSEDEHNGEMRRKKKKKKKAPRLFVK